MKQIFFALVAVSALQSHALSLPETPKAKFCASMPAGERLTPVIRKDAASARFCPESINGAPCLMDWATAMNYCASIGGHVPTSREDVCLLPARGTVAVEASEKPMAQPGYYLVESRNPDGSFDRFLMNHSAYQRPANETEDHAIWTASIPPALPAYAHVFYDQWGGGGLHPAFPHGEDHLLTHKNAVQCVVR